jgi:peptidyl-prolyl cis-trans isomerase D
MRLTSRLFSSVSTKSLFVGSIVVVAVGAFVFTGVGQIGGLDANTAATVGGQTVSMRQLQEVLQDLDRQTQDPAQRQANVQTALNQLVQQKVLVEEANRLGWGAADVEVATWIKQIPSFQNKDTKKFDIEAYNKFLKSGQISELELFRQGREAIAQTKYYSLLTLPDVVPAKLTEEATRRDREEFTLEYVDVAPKEEEVKKAADAEATAFASDTKNEPELRKAYEASKAEFSRKAQVRVKSILVGYKEANRAQGDAFKRTEDEAKVLAEKAASRVQAGEDFSKVAGEINDDANAKAAKGDIGWIDDTNIDPDTAQAAFALSLEKSVSAVLKTPFGFRIVKLEEKRPALEKSFDEVKKELALRNISISTRQKMTASLETEVTEALASGDKAKLDALVASKGLAWKKIAKPVGVNSRFIEELGAADELLGTLFTLKAPGDTSKTLLGFAGKKIAVRLLSRTQAPAPAEGADKQADLLARAEKYQATQAFVSSAQRKLVDAYTRGKEITHNQALFRNQAAQ